MVVGYVSLLCSIGDKPLEYWSKQQSQSGRIRKILDSDLLENVIEIQDFQQPNSYGTSILCPPNLSQLLNIELPILVVVIKNVNLHCRLQVQVVDTQNCLHHFQFTNAEAEKHNSRGVICRAKIKLESGWNKLELNLSNLAETVFKKQYAATQRVQISGNCRLRRVYFIDKHYENQEICPKLYQGFLDCYMLKWGIHTVERSLQTTSRRNKSKIKVSSHLKSVSKHGSSEHLSDDDAGYGATRNSIGRKVTDENFLRNLQLKTDILINSFFDRQSSKLSRVLELKQHAKLKPYALPLVTTTLRSLNPGAISEEVLRKINVFRTFTNTYISADQSCKEDAIKAIQDTWKHRYLLPPGRSVKSSDLTKQYVKRTMLECKPKSLLFLPEKKPDSGKARTRESPKEDEEAIKHNESVPAID